MLVDEPVRGRRVDLGEQFLELIDQQQQLRAVLRQHARRAHAVCLASPASRSSNEGGGSTATPSSASSSCSNGCGAGSHLDREPRTRQGQRAASDRWKQPTPHSARLPAATRTDHGDESPAGAVDTESRDQPFDESFTTEEVDGVDSVESAQPLVRIDRLRRRRSGR